MMTMDLPADKRDAIARLVSESGIAVVKMRPRLKAESLAQLDQKLQNLMSNGNRAALKAAAVSVLDWTSRLFALQLVGRDAVDDICRRLLRVSLNASEPKSALEIDLICRFARQIRPSLSEDERRTFFSRFNSEINAVKLRGDFPQLLERIGSFVSGSPTTSRNSSNSAATLAPAPPPPPKALPAAVAAAVAPGTQLSPTTVAATLVASDNLSSSGAKNAKNNNNGKNDDDDDQKKDANDNNENNNNNNNSQDPNIDVNFEDQINPVNVMNGSYPNSNGLVFSTSGSASGTSGQQNNQNGEQTSSHRRLTRAEEQLQAMLIADNSRVIINLHAKLGEGGFGAVYDGAFDGCSVAIKISFKTDKEADEEILREALHMSRIRSPTCVKCHGIVRLPQLGSRVALIAERCICSVSALHAALDRQQKAQQQMSSSNISNSNAESARSSSPNTPSTPDGAVYAFSPAETFAILQSVVRGVQVLHTNAGIVHRDLKPQNFLIAVEQTTGRIITKLNDFGSCKRDPTAGERAMYSMTAGTTSNVNQGGAGGTTLFLAPELLSSADARATSASDVYSLGVTIFVMMSGVSARTVREVGPDTVEYSFAAVGVPGEITELVQQCVAKYNPAKRPKMADLVDRVNELVQKYPLSPADTARLLEAARSVPAQLQQQQQPAMLSRSEVVRPFDHPVE